MDKNEQQKLNTFKHLYKKRGAIVHCLVILLLVEGTGYETRQTSKDQPIVLILMLKGAVT